jgi:hypothetical protein
MIDSTIIRPANWTNPTSGTLTTNNGSHDLVSRWRSSLLTKELDKTLQKKDSISGNSQETKLLSSSYLGENLFLDIRGVLQSDYFGGHSIDHLSLLLPIILKGLNRLGLSFHLPDEVIDHVGQLIDLDVLNVNATVQLIHNLPYSISSLPDEVNMFIQTVDWVVLLTINTSYLVIQHVDLRQELSPYGGGVLGVPLAPHLALPLLWLKQPSFQQAAQQTRYPICQFVIKERRAKEAPVKPSVALQQERGPDRLSLDQVIIPEVLEVVCQSLWRMVLPPSIDSHQQRIGTIPIANLLGQGHSTPFNRLGSHQPSSKPTTGLPHLLWSMDEHGQTLGRSLKGRNHWSQHIIVGVLNGRKVVLAAGHWGSSCEKDKSEFDGDQSASMVPS